MKLDRFQIVLILCLGLGCLITWISMQEDDRIYRYHKYIIRNYINSSPLRIEGEAVDQASLDHFLKPLKDRGVAGFYFDSKQLADDEASRLKNKIILKYENAAYECFVDEDGFIRIQDDINLMDDLLSNEGAGK